MRTFSAVLFSFLLLISLAGCTGKSASSIGPDEKAARDSVLAFLDQVDEDGIRSAFQTLHSYAFRRYLRTEQYDEEDFIVAFTEHVVDVEGPAEDRSKRVVQADSGGSFNFGFFNQFVSENVDDADPVDLVPYLIEDDPTYLSPRNLDKYAFRMAGDTLMWDRSARIVDVRAKPDLADGENIRRVRYYVDESSNQLVAMYLERIDLGLLFREESRFYLHVRPVPDAPARGGSHVPYNTRFQTRIKTPFIGSFLIRTVSTYTDHRR